MNRRSCAGSVGSQRRIGRDRGRAAERFLLALVAGCAIEFRPIAERQVLRDLVIDKVAEQQSLYADDEDVEKHVAELAQRRGADPIQLRASLQKNDRLKEIQRNLTEERVFEFLIGQSKVKDA